VILAVALENSELGRNSKGLSSSGDGAIPSICALRNEVYEVREFTRNGTPFMDV
jgi:hypothetical protein